MVVVVDWDCVDGRYHRDAICLAVWGEPDHISSVPRRARPKFPGSAFSIIAGQRALVGVRSVAFINFAGIRVSVCIFFLCCVGSCSR